MHQQEWNIITQELDKLKSIIYNEGINEDNWKIIRDEFKTIWNIKRISEMTLIEYTNTDKKYSFTYWIENILKEFGGIHGGTSIKFGIYRMKKKTSLNCDTDGEYCWKKSLGCNNKDDAFKKIKSILIEVINCSNNGNYSCIDLLDLSDMFKWKVSFIYDGKNKIIPIYSKDKINLLIKEVENKSFSELYSIINIDYIGAKDPFIFMNNKYKFLGTFYYELNQSEIENFNLKYDRKNKKIYLDNINELNTKEYIFLKTDKEYIYGRVIEKNYEYNNSVCSIIEVKGSPCRINNELNLNFTLYNQLIKLTYYEFRNVIDILDKHFSRKEIDVIKSDILQGVDIFDINDIKFKKLNKNNVINISTDNNIINNNGIKKDYLKDTIRKSQIGLKGEKIVYELEMKKYKDKEILHRPEHVAQTKGDGLGYDILSYDKKGNKKYIEVKSTNSSKLGGFISSNELKKLQVLKNSYIYFVTNINSKPFIYTLLIIDLNGNTNIELDKYLTPISYSLDLKTI